MSTATAFRFIQAFPFCAEVLVSPGATDYIDNLALSDVMAFYWNTENFAFTTTGTATVGVSTANGTGTTTLNPVGSTIFDRGGFIDGGWYPVVTTATLWASWPAMKQPLERVCAEQLLGPGIVARWLGDLSTNGGIGGFQFIFLIAIDPVNAGKYRLYYQFLVEYTAPPAAPDSAVIRWANPLIAAIGPYTVVASGTFSFNGLTFDYVCSKTAGASSTGGTMSATGSLFTY
jgi:hypothetical protein